MTPPAAAALQNRVAASEAVLADAEEAARVAAEECLALQRVCAARGVALTARHADSAALQGSLQGACVRSLLSASGGRTRMTGHVCALSSVSRASP